MAAITSYYPKYFGVIAHNIEHGVFGSALLPKNCIVPLRGNLHPVW